MELKAKIKVAIFWVITAVWGAFGYSMLSFVAYHWEHHNISFLAFPFAGLILFGSGLLLFGTWMHWSKIVSFVREKLSGKKEK